MNDLNDLNFGKLVPDSLRSDVFFITLGEALEIELKKLYRELEEIVNFDDIDNLPETLIDFLAYEKHVDFYDYSYPIIIKRKLVKESILFHRKKGTPNAVEDLVTTVFGDGRVIEWFNYSDTPYMFKVSTSNPDATHARAEEFIRAVNAFKNARSHLEYVELIGVEEMKLYWGGLVQIGSKELYK